MNDARQNSNRVGEPSQIPSARPRSLGRKARIQQPRRDRQRIHPTSPRTTRPLRQVAEGAEKKMSLETGVAKFLVDLLILCEQHGIVRINRDWLKAQEAA